MRILFLSQYFPPEIGAPQNRLHGLAVRLLKKGADVKVLTAMPNYPEMKVHQEYEGKWFDHEERDGLEVYRSYVYCSQKLTILRRMLNYLSFTFSSVLLGMSRVPHCDLIICESPPLSLAITAILLKWRHGARLVFNVSDLWPESARQLGLVRNRLVLSLAGKLEMYAYRHSDLITGQTNFIVDDIKRRTGREEVYWLPNGIDMELYQGYLDETGAQDAARERNAWRSQFGFGEDDFIILYAGILGHAQKLETILRAAQQLSGRPQIKFLLLGTGPCREELLRLKEKIGVTNVMFENPVPKNEMPDVLNAIDAGVVPLARHKLFTGAIPSKIFELLVMKKPLLLGVEGEAKRIFIDETPCGLAFEPEDQGDLAAKARQLAENRGMADSFGENGHKLVMRDFTFRTIADKLWRIILQ